MEEGQTVQAPASLSVTLAETVSPSARTTIADSGDTAKIDSAVAGVLSELKRYRGYHRRWDGYFAEPFRPEVLDRALYIVLVARQIFVREQIVPSLMTTGPASDGSMDVEIRESKKTLFYTIYPDTWGIDVTAIIEGEAPIRRTIRFEEMALARWLDWLVCKRNLPQDVEANRSHP